MEVSKKLILSTFILALYSPIQMADESDPTPPHDPCLEYGEQSSGWVQAFFATGSIRTSNISALDTKYSTVPDPVPTSDGNRQAQASSQVPTSIITDLGYRITDDNGNKLCQFRSAVVRAPASSMDGANVFSILQTLNFPQFKKTTYRVNFSAYAAGVLPAPASDMAYGTEQLGIPENDEVIGVDFEAKEIFTFESSAYGVRHIEPNAFLTLSSGDRINLEDGSIILKPGVTVLVQAECRRKICLRYEVPTGPSSGGLKN